MKTKTDEAFEQFIKEMKLKLDQNQDKKGDSWVTCDMNFLENKLLEELHEYYDAESHMSKRRELIDVANVCMMLATRHFGNFMKNDAEKYPDPIGLEGSGR
jgi:predicted house-cleaning noncanonical NTP pyrophosphatase (MazG superfamily)